MNASSRTGIFAAFAFMLLAAQASAGSWEHNFERAQAKAKQTGLPILIHFHASWCGPCRRMESTVLNQAQVQQHFGTSVIAVKVDSDQRRDIASRYGVTALPTDVIVTADGRRVRSSTGALALSSYVQLLTSASVHRSTPAKASSPETKVAKQTTKPAEAKVKEDVTTETVVASKPVFPSIDDKGVSEAAKSGASVAGAGTGKAGSADAAAAKEVGSDRNQEDSKVAKKASAVRKAITNIDGVRTGLHGFCPVSLARTAKWVSGAKDIQHEFDGIHYRFVSEEERDLFKADPEKFVPALRGYDPVSIAQRQVVRAGVLSLGARYQGQVFFFATKKNRDEFLIAPSDYADGYRLTFFKSAAAEDNSSADKG